MNPPPGPIPPREHPVRRDFVVKERYRLNLRAEFTNIFNRANIPNPTSVNALAKQTVNTTTGTGTAGFG